MCMLAASTFRPTTSVRLPFSPRARAQIGLFLLAYAVYTVARFFTIGDLSDAMGNAHWIVDVENAEQAERLRRIGCDTGQGWHYSRPVAPEAIEGLIR